MADEQVRVLRVRSEESGSDKVAAALNAVAAGATAADKAVAKYAADAARSVQPVAEALAKSQDDFSKATLSTAKSIQNLQNRIDPVAKALSAYESAQKRVNLAIDSGQISAAKGATILAGYEANYVKASTNANKFANDNEKAFALNRAGMMELQAAGINAFQALAAGMAPLQVAMMEGSQVVGAFIQGTEGGLLGLASKVKGGALSIGGAALGALATPGGAIAGVFTAGVAAAGAYALYLHEKVPSLDDVIKEHTKLIGDIAKAFPAATAAAKQYEDQIGKLPQATAVADIQDQLKKEKELYANQLKSVQNTTSPYGSPVSADDDSIYGRVMRARQQGLSKQFGPGNLDALNKIAQEVRSGNVDAGQLQKQISELRIPMEDLSPAAQKWLKSLEQSVSVLADMQHRMQGLKAAQDALVSATAAGPGGLPMQFMTPEQKAGLAPGSGDSARQKAISDQATKLAQMESSLKAELQSINARTVAQRAAAASASIMAQPVGKDSSPQIRSAEAAAASQKVFAQATREANDALRDSQDALKTVGLDGYSRSLAEINVQLQKQIELNPENAATWKLIADAQKKALDIETNKALFEPIEEQIRATQAEADAIGKSDDAHRQILATLQAEETLRQKGIDLNSKYAESYVKVALVASDYAAAVAKQKAAWDSVHSAEGSVIDDLVGSLDNGDWKSALKSAENDILKFGTTMAVSNPLKNLVTGSTLPTFGDLFTGKLKSPSLSLAGLGSLGTAMNPMYVIPTTGAGGIGGAGSSGLAGLFTDPIGTVSKWLGLGGSSGGNPTVGAAASAIKSIESSGNYSALGPVLASGDRAYGAYQIMGANIPSWTKQALGYSMTPDQFLNSSSAQDSVFAKIFGGYMSKYGPSGAAQAWFGGPGSIGKNVSDVLGTSSSEYVDKFNAALGSATDATGVAAKGLGTLGNGFSQVGNSLANGASSGPSGGGGLFGWLGGLFGSSAFPAAPAGPIASGMTLADWGFAAGTPAAPPGWAWVGEEGPELMRFRGGETVLPHPTSMGLVRGYANGTPDVAKGLKPPSSGAGGNVNVNIQPPAGYEAQTQRAPDGRGGMNVNVMFRQIKGMLAKDIAEGGQTAKAIGGRFGMSMVPQT